MPFVRQKKITLIFFHKFSNFTVLKWFKKFMKKSFRASKRLIRICEIIPFTYIFFFFHSAGYKMMSVTDPALCRRVTLRHALLQIPFAALVSYFGVANWSFFVLSLPFNVYLSLLSWEFYKNSNNNTARKLFRFTLLHLPVLMFFMIICSRNTKSKELARNQQQKSELEAVNGIDNV